MSGPGAATQPAAAVGRNDPCPCGSGKKFKHCCQAKQTGAGSPVEAGARPSAATRQTIQTLFVMARKHWDAGQFADAVKPFREIARLDPNRAEGHHDLGVALLSLGKTAQAVASLQRAVELRPGFATALRPLVDALEADGREADALIACRKLSRVADDPTERRYYSAKALAKEGKLEEAETELRRLLVLGPRDPRTRPLLGEVLSQRGMFEEAARYLAEAVDEVPNCFLHLTAVKRMTEADCPLLERMQAVAERPDLAATPRISVHFGLGKAFEDLGDYATAIRHYDTGNRIKASSQHLNRAALVSQYDSTIAAFSAEGLEQAAKKFARPVCPGDDMPVFIVGMPRSGTTLTEQILSSHPAVAAGGELTFLRMRIAAWRAAKIGALDAEKVAKAAEDYRAELRGIGPKALRVTNKAPRDFELLWLVRLAFPGAHIIHCRRHPVDTCLSNYLTVFGGHQDYSYDRGDLVFFYRQYERLMDHWRKVLPADRFTEVDYEALVDDRETETRRLVAFCGLEWDDACLAPERNERTVATASVWQARQPVYKTSVERWRRFEPWLGELRELMPAEDAAAS